MHVDDYQRTASRGTGAGAARSDKVNVQQILADPKQLQVPLSLLPPPTTALRYNIGRCSILIFKVMKIHVFPQSLSLA